MKESPLMCILIKIFRFFYPIPSFKFTFHVLFRGLLNSCYYHYYLAGFRVLLVEQNTYIISLTLGSMGRVATV